jgi:hypothetical protein
LAVGSSDFSSFLHHNYVRLLCLPRGHLVVIGYVYGASRVEPMHHLGPVRSGERCKGDPGPRSPTKPGVPPPSLPSLPYSLIPLCPTSHALSHVRNNLNARILRTEAPTRMVFAPRAMVGTPAGSAPWDRNVVEGPADRRDVTLPPPSSRSSFLRSPRFSLATDAQSAVCYDNPSRSISERA